MRRPAERTGHTRLGRVRRSAAGLLVAALVGASGVVGIGVATGQHPEDWFRSAGSSAAGSAMGAGTGQSDRSAQNQSAVAVADRAGLLGQLQPVLDAAAAGVLRRDASGVVQTVAPASSQLRKQRLRLVANLRDVPLKAWTYEITEVIAEDGLPLSQTRAVNLTVIQRYQLAQDPTTVRRDRHLTLAKQTDGHWLITGDTLDAGEIHDPWDLGPVTVVRSGRSVVLGLVSSTSQLHRYAAMVDQSAAKVDAVWGTAWPRVSVVVVPVNQQQMAAMMGRTDQQGLNQIAAVTTGDVGTENGGTAGQAGRVIVNPAAMAALRPQGRTIILTHEMTHLATRFQTTAPPPMWLAEGFADFVAFKDSGLATKAIAGSAVSARQQVPDGLPLDSRFDPRVASVDAAYSQAWLATTLIATRWSTPQLVAFYRAVTHPAASQVDVAADDRVDAALAAVLHTNQATLLTLWRARVHQVTGAAQ